ncbi:MAG: hypothetical protein EBS86_16345, partial [Crocinitomicaceae bacterium]|nr:hypothetical protein [Crocinitomicaceae bacterium]
MQTEQNQQKKYFIFSKKYECYDDGINANAFYREIEYNTSIENEIQNNNYFVDVNKMKNIFKVISCDIEANNTYQIIAIHKQQDENFQVNDIIHFSDGMLAFYTMNNDGKINKSEIAISCIIETNKITLFDSVIEEKLNDVSQLIDDFTQNYG